MQRNPPSAGEGGDSKSRAADRLDSWKEIAAFFRREVRTVQLWEKSEGLPVRRQQHKKLGSVYAYCDELDAWRRARSAPRSGPGGAEDAHGPLEESGPQREPFSHEEGGLRMLALPFEVIDPALEIAAKRQLVERFARGLQNDLVLELARSKFHPVVLPLNSIPPEAASALAWANEIAAELEIDTILSGTIRHSGSQLRVSMQLVRSADMLCLWSDRFDAELENTFDAQAELAQRISSALPDCQTHCLKARKRAPSANSGLAFHACCMGFHSWQQGRADALRKAASYFSDAIELDPEYAEAYAGLADTYISLSYQHLMPAQQAAGQAWKAAQTALTLNPHSINVNNAYLNSLIYCSWNLGAAERHCRKMIDAGKLDARTLQLYSSIMILRSRHQDSIRLALRACELAPEPDQIRLNGQVSLAYFYSGDYSNAISIIRRTLDRQPLYLMDYALLGRAEAQLGNWDEAISAFTTGLAISGGSLFGKALLASAYAGSGAVSRAHAILHKLGLEKDNERFPSYDVSAAYAVLNEEQEALSYMRGAFDKRDMMTLYIGHDPRFSSLRKSAEFQRILSFIDRDRTLPAAV